MRYVYMTLAFAGCLAATSAGFADEQPEELETIVVTASRIPTPIAEVASSVTVIERQHIVDRQSIFVSDLLRDVPGVAVSRQGPAGTVTEVRIRGAEANQVMVLIDGIKANDPAFTDTFSFTDLTSFDVERVEVVRGPQSALWGSDAMAGVINVITRRPEEGPTTEAFLEGGSFETIVAGGRFATQTDRYQFDGSLSYLDSDGSNIARSGDENDGYENITATVRAGYTTDSSINLEFVGRYTGSTTEFDTIDSQCDPITFVCTGTGLPADANLETDNSQTFVRFGGDLRSFDGHWKNVAWLAASNTDHDRRADGVKTGSDEGQRYGVYYQSTWDFAPQERIDSAQTVTFAIDHERLEYTRDDLNKKMDTTGFVFEGRTRFWEDLYLSAAVRHDSNSDFDDVNTWRVTSLYTFAETGTQLHADFGTGQKAPTFTERFSFFPAFFIGNPDLEPEKSRGWEFGLNQPFADGRWAIQATYFKERLENEIAGFVFDPVTFLFTAENVDGTSHRTGVETALQASITNAFDAAATYTYLDADQSDGAGGFTAEVRRPRHMASANFNYRFMESRGNINLNLSYTGDHYDTFFPPGAAGQQVKLDSYTLVNLAASYQATDRVRVYGRIENLFDEAYEDVIGFNTPGIGAFVGVQVKSGR
jgi:vitamin B12 transporter